MGLQHYTQDMSRIPLKYHTNVLFYTKYTHPMLICRGTDARTDWRMDARTDRRTENIYSIFRDKLLLLGEHIFPIAIEQFCPMNSPPLSCRHCTEQGYQQSQLCVNLSRICLAVLLSMQISSTRFKAISMQVIALNSTCQPFTLTFHGPIKSMATSSHGAICSSCLGRRP